MIGLFTKTGAAVCSTNGDSTEEGAAVVFGGMTRAWWPVGRYSRGEQKNGFVTESLSASQSDCWVASCMGLPLLKAAAAAAAAASFSTSVAVAISFIFGGSCFYSSFGLHLLLSDTN